MALRIRRATRAMALRIARAARAAAAGLGLGLAGAGLALLAPGSAPGSFPEPGEPMGIEPTMT